nr:MAG TPA: hypothetical protein [Bacteriophage sp.]
MIKNMRFLQKRIQILRSCWKSIKNYQKKWRSDET